MGVLGRVQYRHKIAAVILLCTLMPLVASGAVLFKRIWNERVQSVLAEHTKNIGTYAAITDRLMAACSQKSMFIKANSQVISYLSLEQSKDMVSTLTFTDYMQELVRAVNADNSNTVIRLFALRNSFELGDYYRSESSFRKELAVNETDLEEQILNLNYSDVLWKMRTLNRDRNSTQTREDFLCLYRRIDTSDFTAGIIEVGMPVRYLQELYPEKIPDGSFIAMTIPSADGKECITVKNEAGIEVRNIVETYEKSGNGEKYHVIGADLDFSKGRVYLFIPNGYIVNEMNQDVILLIVGLLLIVALLIAAVEVISYFLTRKLSGLIGKMNKDLDELINSEEMEIYNSDDEIGRIGNKVFRLIKRVKEYYIKASEYESQKRLLELELLQARFNPHFLYNTLGTIKCIIKDRKVHNVIDSMVRYYRIALNKGSMIIHISKELELVSEYLKLQKFAYGSDVEVVLEIGPEVEEYSIIKHLLQPIVENALLHGVAGTGTGGIIKIKADRREGDIVFEISDNGAGMDQEKVQRLLEGDNGNSPGGYGIKNVQKRIAVYYGAQYGLCIESGVGKGTCVVMRIPAIVYEDALAALEK